MTGMLEPLDGGWLPRERGGRRLVVSKGPQFTWTGVKREVARR